jgi:GT2 family glycosyltransferase
LPGRNPPYEAPGMTNTKPPRKQLVTIGIVTWNSGKDLAMCLAGLAAQDYPEIEIIAVDNASTDDSPRLLREALPHSQILVNKENLGYGAAHNQAIRAARGEFYLPLNPDLGMRPGFVGCLVDALNHHTRCGSAVGKILQATDPAPALLDSAGLFIDRRRHQYLRGYGEPDRGQYDRPEEVFGADGAAPLHRKAMLQDVEILGEYFDEQHFIYMEDVDLAWRARLFGWGCWYEPQATAVHKRTFKPGERRLIPKDIRRCAVKNRYLTIVKNENRECWRRDWPRILTYDLMIWAYVMLCEQKSLAAIPMLRKQWGRALAWRKEIVRRVKVAPNEQRAWFK